MANHGEVTINYEDPDELYLLVQVEQGPEGPKGPAGAKGDAGRNGQSAPMQFNAMGGSFDSSVTPAPSGGGSRAFSYFMS